MLFDLKTLQSIKIGHFSVVKLKDIHHTLSSRSQHGYRLPPRRKWIRSLGRVLSLYTVCLSRLCLRGNLRNLNHRPFSADVPLPCCIFYTPSAGWNMYEHHSTPLRRKEALGLTNTPGEAFGYYGRAWSHESRTDIKSWAL